VEKKPHWKSLGDTMTKETDLTTADKNDLAQAADFGFEANVEQLLELMTHSVYSERCLRKRAHLERR